MIRSRQNIDRAFVAACGHIVMPLAHFVQESDGGNAFFEGTPTITSWCGPTCADLGERRQPTCGWKGCDEPGKLCDIDVAVSLPEAGVTVKATFSQDVALCPYHEGKVEATVADLLMYELTDDEEKHEAKQD